MLVINNKLAVTSLSWKSFPEGARCRAAIQDDNDLGSNVGFLVGSEASDCQLNWH
jgi:hypothetical protein